MRSSGSASAGIIRILKEKTMQKPRRTIQVLDTAIYIYIYNPKNNSPSLDNSPLWTNVSVVLSIILYANNVASHLLAVPVSSYIAEIHEEMFQIVSPTHIKTNNFVSPPIARPSVDEFNNFDSSNHVRTAGHLNTQLPYLGLRICRFLFQ